MYGLEGHVLDNKYILILLYLQKVHIEWTVLKIIIIFNYFQNKLIILFY